MSSEIAELIDRKIETANLEYKEGFIWNRENRNRKFDLIKDIMAMANTRDGGTIILGVKDGSYELIGVSEEVRDSLDQTDIGQMLHRYGKPKATMQVQKKEIQGKFVVAINVAEFDDVPIICADAILDANSSRSILRKGAIYVRTSAATTEEICSDQDMRELLGRAILKRGDELLRNIESMIKGKPLVQTDKSVNLYQREIQEADIWFREVLQKGFLTSPRWEFIVCPSDYESSRIGKLPQIERLVQECQVDLRGWPFPYIGNKAEASNFNLGFRGYVDWEEIREGFRFYKSGLFIFKRALWEDLRGMKTQSGKRTLSFISAIYSLTEWLLFIARAYETLGGIASLHLTVSLIGCQQRQLSSFDSQVFLPDYYESQEDKITFTQDIKMIELRTSEKDIAKRIAMHLFHVFNWTNVSDEYIQDWQRKLVTRSF